MGAVAGGTLLRCAAAHSAAAAAEIFQVLVFPCNDVDDAGDLFCSGNIDALHHRICVGAPEKFGKKHVVKDIVAPNLALPVASE